MSVSKFLAASLSILFANGAASQFEKDVLKVGENGAKACDPDPIRREAVNHLGDQIVATPLNGETHIGAGYRLYFGNPLKVVTDGRVAHVHNHGTLWAMPPNQAIRRVDVYDPSVLHDGYPVA